MANDERKPKPKMTKRIFLCDFGFSALSFFRASSFGFGQFPHV